MCMLNALSGFLCLHVPSTIGGSSESPEPPCLRAWPSMLLVNESRLLARKCKSGM